MSATANPTRIRLKSVSVFSRTIARVERLESTVRRRDRVGEAASRLGLSQPDASATAATEGRLATSSQGRRDERQMRTDRLGPPT